MVELPQTRHRVTALPGPESKRLMARRDATVAAGVSTALPVFISHASGAILQDVDGNRIVDLGSGIGVTSVGHAAPEVVARVQAQVADMTHTCFMITPYQQYVEVCEALADVTPGTHDKRSALFNSGAEAVENAVKIARHHTRRTAVAVFDHAYHGRTNLTMAMTAKNMPYKQGFGPLAGEVYRAPMSYPFRDPSGMTGATAADRAIDLLEKQVGSRNLACVVVEPIQGEGGFIVPANGFLPAVAEWCRDNEIVFVADEVQSGFCRTGEWFASDHEAVVPDLVTTAKGIAGGLPLAAVTGRADIMSAVHAGGLGGTYGGNPVACAAALGAIRTMRELDLSRRARDLGRQMVHRLTGVAEASPFVGEIRGRGAMVAVEFSRPGSKEPAPHVAARISAACHAEGVLTLTCGTHGNVLRLLPPLVIGDALLDDALSVLCSAIEGSSSAVR